MTTDNVAGFTQTFGWGIVLETAADISSQVLLLFGSKTEKYLVKTNETPNCCHLLSEYILMLGGAVSGDS